MWFVIKDILHADNIIRRKKEKGLIWMQTFAGNSDLTLYAMQSTVVGYAGLAE